MHAGSPLHEEAMLPADGSHCAPVAVYCVKHELHWLLVT